MASYTFEAPPKVVKTHAKYKPDSAKGPSSALTTFNKLMQDNRIKTMNPVNQEQEYVRLEKERIKIDNMQSQLLHFKKNKKKMTPYDIKPSPNPRIEVNLQFFLHFILCSFRPWHCRHLLLLLIKHWVNEPVYSGFNRNLNSL